MRDVDRALADIANIRQQLGAGALFRGFGPAVMAATGVLAVVTAGAQTIWPKALVTEAWVYLACWAATAVACAGMVGVEAWARSRRHHGGLADAMVTNAIEQFLPVGIAGAALMLVIMRVAPDVAWILPGVWQLLFALGLFAAAKNLPRSMRLVGAWYMVAGLGVLVIASADRALTPWLMGAPFAIGQLMMAAVLKFATETRHDEV